MIEDGSGATVNPNTGAYLSGEVIDVEDRVQVTDGGCDGSATARVRVVSAITVAPREVEMRPGTTFDFEITGGSGEYTCEFIAEETSGEVTPNCSYTAGSEAGVDIVRIFDAQTGDHVDSTLTVDPAATLEIAGGGRIFIPLGQRFWPRPFGGSSHLQPEIMSGPLSIVEDAIRADSQGSGSVRFTDRFTGMEVQAPVSVVTPIAPNVERDGERSGGGAIHDAGDLNGDGYPDAVFGFIELSMGAHYSGGVLVYPGGPAGLSTMAEQVFSGTTRTETFGRDIEIADVNNDGEQDLLIGADNSDLGSVNNGGVMIHYGVPGGFFEDTPSRVLRGQATNDRFGYSVVACDFDADGFLDLAIGALRAEDVNVAIPAEDQGAIHVFRGSESGYSDKADFVIFGQLPDSGGTFEHAADMELGHTMRAGDLDGDGLCDLVAAAPDIALTDLDDDGVVLVYKGTTENNLYLTRTPVRIYAAPGDTGQLGERMSIGDINNDGIDDLAIGHRKARDVTTQGGAVRVFLGGDLEDRPPHVPVLPDEADWYVNGETSYEWVGSDVSIADFDGDNYADLIVGVPRGEQDSPINAGLVRVYSGDDMRSDIASAPGGYDATGDTPVATFVYDRAYSRFGQAVATAGPGAILSLAGYDDTFGTQVGAPFYASVSAPNPKLLSMPGQAAGHEFGRGIALFDMNGDGDRDLLIGGPGAASESIGGNSGLVAVYRNQSGTFSNQLDSITEGYPTHAGGDRYGYGISTAGDFNNDGIEDLAVLGRGATKPSVFDEPEWANPNACPGYISRAGAVLVYLGMPGGGVEEQPAFIYFGYGTEDYIRVVRGGFDYDGDGYDDVAVGSYTWDSDGGMAIVFGQNASSAGTTIICSADRYLGIENQSRLGYSVSPLGDLNGDGCDEVATGAPRENLGVPDQGVIRVLWGAGSGCAFSQPQVTTMGLEVFDTELGTSLDGGHDIDDDGIPDMVVGGTNYRVEFAAHGGAWFVPGSHILSLPRQSISAGNLPSESSTVLSPMLPQSGDLGRFGVVGPMAASLFGEAVAMIPDPTDSNRWALAVGIPRGNTGGTSLSGGVAIYRFRDPAPNGYAGLEEIPYAVLGGETSLPAGLLGSTLRGYELGGEGFLVVGAPRSAQFGMDIGAAYVLRFP